MALLYSCWVVFQSGLPPGDESPALPREALVRSTWTYIIQTSKSTPASKRVLTCLLNIDIIWYNLSLNSCRRECRRIISIMVVMLLFNLNDCYFYISSDKVELYHLICPLPWTIKWAKPSNYQPIIWAPCCRYPNRSIPELGGPYYLEDEEHTVGLLVSCFK